MALGEWRRARYEQAQRLFIAMAGLVLVRVCCLVAAVIAQTGWVDSDVLLPPLERCAGAASIIILGWAFMPPARRNVYAWDLVFGATLALVVGAGVAFVALWDQALSGDPALDYNAYWQSTIWSVWQMGLLLLAALAVIRDQGAGWTTVLVAVGLLFVGQVLQLAYPLGTVPHVPVWERLFNLAAYTLLPIAVYKRIFADLTVQSRQLQDISQASLDQIKSLLYLVEASQQVSSSLELSEVLENAVQGVARALEADQCAIAFPSETDPGQMRLVAIYNPMRQGRREAASFPLEYQLAIQQAMRRKDHVIIEEADNVQLRALFALLGSSQTGPLLVQPLLDDQEAVGAMIVGNGRSRRPFGPNEVKLCQALAHQVVTAIENTRRYRTAQDRIAEMITAQNKTRRASLQARAEIQELSDRLAGTRAEIEALRQARDDLELKLVSSRAETDTLSRRLATLESDLARRQAGGSWLMQAGLPDTPVGIIVTDAKGLILATNAVAEGYLVRKTDELQRLDLRAISDELQWSEAVAAAAKGEAVQLMLPLGTRTLVCAVAPLSGPGADEGQVEGLAVILQDPLAQAQKTQPESVAAVLEGLHNPMTTIIGYVDLLLSEAMGSVGEAQRKFLRRIKSSAEQVVQAIRDRQVGYGTEPGPVDAGEDRPAFLARRAVQVEKLVARTVAQSRAQFEDKNLKLDLELDDALPVVEANPDHLERVLSCLLSNACLASREGGRIEVQATWFRSEDLPIEVGLCDEDSDGFVTVSVRDSGGGLAEDASSQLFEQTRPSQSPPGLGESGAALAQAKALVEAHGGCLWVETEKGVGTTFGFALPLDEQGGRLLMNRSLGERDVVIVG